jgi:hypothetical protein
LVEARGAGAYTYSRAELIDLAQSRSSESRVAWEESRPAALAVGMVEALYLPALSVCATAYPLLRPGLLVQDIRQPSGYMTS